MIITLCGSARFEDQFKLWSEVLTLSGHTVFSLAVYPSDKNGIKDWYSLEDKVQLDMAHLRKIDASGAIMVLNKHAYIGQSTLSEIEYARGANKTVFALESWGAGKGIRDFHIDAIQENAKSLNVFNYGSPIDTFSPHMKGWHGLLPPAGSYRSKLIARLDAADALTQSAQPSDKESRDPRASHGAALLIIADLNKEISDLKDKLQGSGAQVPDMHVSIAKTENDGVALVYAKPDFGGDRIIGNYRCYLQSHISPSEVDAREVRRLALEDAIHICIRSSSKYECEEKIRALSEAAPGREES